MTRGDERRHRPSRATAQAPWVCAALLAMGASVHAQPIDPTRRRMLLDQAEEARRAGDHQRSLERALEAGAQQMTPSVRMFIAEEHEALGNLREALVHSRACVRETTEMLSVNNRELILARCEQLLRSVESRMATVSLRFAGVRPAGLQVVVADLTLTEAQFEQDIPVPAGQVTLEASAPGRPTWSRTLTLSPGAREPVEVRFDEGPRAVPARTEPRDVTQAERGGSAWPWVVAGVGGATAIAGVLVYATLYGTAREQCQRALACAPSTDAGSSLDRTGTTSMILVGAGAGMVLSGVVWLLVGARGSEPPRATAGVAFDAHGAQVTLGGRF